MIEIKEQENLFLQIARKLKTKVNCYAIGGTALMFLGLKAATLDIDLVFDKDLERRAFKEAAKLSGFNEMDSRIMYGKKENVPEVVKRSDSRIDMFLFKVINSTFSESMQKRSVNTHQFAENLFIRVADVHDILIMKSITGRLKDEEDIVRIISTSKVDWNIIIEEAKNQIELGNTIAILDLGATLEGINNKKLSEIPKSVLDELFGLFKQQAKTKVR